MSKIYTGQDWKLTLIGDVDLTAGSAVIQYRKGDGETVNEKNATIAIAATAACFYNFVPADLDAVEDWIFWLKLTLADGSTQYGEPYKRHIFAPGS